MKPNITITALATIVLGLFTSSCDSGRKGGSESPPSETSSAAPEEHLPRQFAFIEESLGTITLEEVVNRIGPYHKVGHLTPTGREIVYEFDSPDHSALLVILERPFDNRNRVHRVRWLPNTNGFELFP